MKPFPHTIMAESCMPSVHSSTQEVLVLDMNGVLLRRYIMKRECQKVQGMSLNKCSREAKTWAQNVG